MGKVKRGELIEKKKEYMKTVYTTTKRTYFKKLPRAHQNAFRTLQYMQRHSTSPESMLDEIANGELKKREKTLVTWAVTYCKEIDYILKKTGLHHCTYVSADSLKIFLAQSLYGCQRTPKGARESAELFYYEEDVMDAFVEACTVFGTTYIAECIPTYVRINTLSISLEKCISAFCKEGWKLLECPKNYNDYLYLMYTLKEKEFIRDFHISELLVFPPATSFYKHPGYLRGKFVLQDKGSCLASFLLNPKPGSRVFDMGAATGKTTNHIANIVNNEGNVYAADHHPHRFRKLESFLKLTNSTCVESIMSDVKLISIDDLDYILLDVSCTNSGVQYERTDKGLSLRLRRSYYLNFKLLLYALQNFPTVKRVVYAARSIFPEEGEKVVDFALKVVKQSYQLLDVKELLWNEWYTFGKTETNCGSFPFASKCLRTDPIFEKCFGYFIAVFERNFEVPVPRYGFEKWERPEEDDDESDDDSSDERFPKVHYKLLHGFPKRIKDPNSITKPTTRPKPTLIKIPNPNAAKKSLLLATPQTSASSSASLSMLGTSKGTPTLLSMPQNSASTRVLLPTPGTFASTRVLLPTPQTFTRTPVQFPMPAQTSSNRVLLPTPQTSTRNPALVSMPQTFSNNRVLLPTPQPSTRNPVLLPTPQTFITANRR